MMIATVIDVQGDVLIKKVDGTTSQLSSGDTIEVGDTVINGDDASHYRVKYADNGGDDDR